MNDHWIICGSKISVGEAAIPGTTLSIEMMLEKLCRGMPVDLLIAAHPGLTKDAVREVFGIAAAAVRACRFHTRSVESQTENEPSDANEIANETYRACRLRDALAADRLEALATEIDAGALKYDGPIMNQMAEISDYANHKATETLCSMIAAKLNPGEQLYGSQEIKARELRHRICA